MQKKIKVLHICDKFSVGGSSIHGVGRLFSWWFPRFDDARFDLVVAGLRGEDQGSQGLRDEGLNVRTLNKGKFDLTTLNAVVALIKEEKPDLVHLHGYGATVFGIPAGIITKTKIILHEHFVDPVYPSYQKIIDFFLCRKAAISIANCAAVEDFMVESRSVSRSKTKVVFNGVPLEEFQRAEPSDIQNEKSKWGIPEGYEIVATVGRLDEQKGNTYFLDAAKIILDQGLKIKFMVVGDGPLMEELKEKAVKLGIDNDLVFAGYQENISLIQSIFDIQVIPSLWEGTTLTVFEAMSVGVPLVSTDVDGLGEVLVNEVNALTVPSASGEALAKAIITLIEQPGLKAALSVQAKKDVNNYSIQGTVDNLQNIYMELLGK